MSENTNEIDNQPTNTGVIIEKLNNIQKEVSASNVKIDKLSDRVDTNFASKETVMGIERRVTVLEKVADDNLVTKDQFWPVKTIVYGLVAIILIAVLGAIIALVVIK